MKQTLKQRIVPEVDERETERESEKVASYVEESLKDISPIDDGDPLFDTDQMFNDLEEMKDMTDDFFGDGFSVPGSDGFAGDMLFENEGTEKQMETSTEQLESLRDLEQMFREMGGLGGGGALEPILAVEELLGQNIAQNSAVASAVAGMSSLLKAGGATLLLGGVGLAILGGIWSSVKSIAKHSPLLENVVEMLGMVSTFLIRPFAHMIGQMLLPIMMDLLQVSAEFMSISFEEGIMNGMVYLGKTFLDAIFSLPGLVALGITAAGGALGAAIGSAAAAKIGGTIGAILGSVVPGIGTTVGAALGATIGVTLAGILGVLTAYNLNELLTKISEFIDDLNFNIFAAMEYLSSLLEGATLQVEGKMLRNIAVGLTGLMALRGGGIGGVAKLLGLTGLKKFGTKLIARMGLRGMGQRILARFGPSAIAQGLKARLVSMFSGTFVGRIASSISSRLGGRLTSILISRIGGLFGKGMVAKLVSRFAGSFVPGLNMVLWGDLIFELIFGFSPIFDWLLPALISGFKKTIEFIKNIPSMAMNFVSDSISFGGDVLAAVDEKIGMVARFLKDVFDAIDIIKFIVYGILGPFGLIAIEFIDWIKKKWGKDIAKMAQYVKDLFNEFSSGGLSAVFNKVVEDSDVRQILRDVIPRFDVWQQIKNGFPGWPGIPSFDIWERVKALFPGWPSIPSFDVWQTIENLFPGWPDLSWDGWGSFVDNVDLSDKVPKIDWNVPELPSRSEIAQFIEDILRPGVDAELEDYTNETESNTGDGDGESSGGEGRDPDDPRDAPSANPPGSLPDDDNDDTSYDPGDDASGGIGDPGYGTGLASGGIVTDTLMTYVGEGRESEVVMPLSKLDSVMSSREPQEPQEISGSISGIDEELESALTNIEDSSDENNDEVIRQLKRIVRQITGLRNEMDLTVEENSDAKWEVK